VANARRARCFAASLGERNKTDTVDARALRICYGYAVGPLDTAHPGSLAVAGHPGRSKIWFSTTKSTRARGADIVMESMLINVMESIAPATFTRTHRPGLRGKDDYRQRRPLHSHFHGRRANVLTVGIDLRGPLGLEPQAVCLKIFDLGDAQVAAGID
jgi:hypothetical protein